LGISATNIREIVPLPALAPYAEAPAWIAGMLRLRDATIPVVDLQLRLGFRRRQRRPTDSVVVVEHRPASSGSPLRLGLLVEEVQDVRRLTGEGAPPAFGTGARCRPEYVFAVAPSGSGVVQILDLDALFHVTTAAELAGPEDSTEPPDESQAAAEDAAAPPDENGLYQQRRRELAGSDPDAAAGDGWLGDRHPLAIVRLGPEYFALEPRYLLEFREFASVAVVPCCPPHVVGVVNLRGQLLTLLDIRGVLGLPAAPLANPVPVAVVESGEFLVGLVLDEICEFMEVPGEALMPLGGVSSSQGFITGGTRYRETMAGLVDLPRLLEEGNLVVNEGGRTW
jgi:purine-binding chemotaxis protein CheW